MFKDGQVTAIILAAGTSRRMDGQDKLLAELGGRPLITRTLGAFASSPLVDELVLVVGQHKIDKMTMLCKQYNLHEKTRIVAGGARRQDSVAAGLKEATGVWVLVHDGARPMVTGELIAAVLKTAASTGAAVPALPVTDTIKQAEESRVVRTLDRSNLYAIQTPQAFRYAILQEAYRQAETEATDDAQLVEKTGITVSLCEGCYDNIKVTTPLDLELARSLINRRGCEQ